MTNNTYVIITKKNNKTSIIRKLVDNESEAFNLENPEYDYAAVVDVPEGIEWPKKFRSKRRIECYADVYKFIREMYDAEET